MAVEVDLLNSNSLSNIDTNFQRIDTALQDAVSRSGDTPNEMEADFDMNSFDILNAGQVDVEVLTINGELVLPNEVDVFPLADGDKGDITVTGGGAIWTVDVGVIDESNLNTSLTLSTLSPIVGTRTELKAVDTSRYNRASLSEDVPLAYGRFGTFNFVAANLSTLVTADPLEGIYVAPDSDPTGASGAWVRQFTGPLNVCWWGARGDNLTDCHPAFQAIVNFIFARAEERNVVYIPVGKFRLNDEVNIFRGGSDIDIAFTGDTSYDGTEILANFYGATKGLFKAIDPAGAARCGPRSFYNLFIRPVTPGSGTNVNPIMIDIAGWGQGTIRNCKFSSSNNTAFSIGSLQNCQIEDVEVFFCGKSWLYKDTDSSLFNITGAGATQRTLTCTNNTPFTTGDVGQTWVSIPTTGNRIKWNIVAFTDSSNVTIECDTPSNTTGSSGYFGQSLCNYTSGSSIIGAINTGATVFIPEDVGRILYIQEHRSAPVSGARSIGRGRILSYTDFRRVTIADEWGTAINAGRTELSRQFSTPAIDLYTPDTGGGNLNAGSTDVKIKNLRMSDPRGVAVGLINMQELQWFGGKLEGDNDMTSSSLSHAQLWIDDVRGVLHGVDLSTHGGFGRERIYVSNQTGALTLDHFEFRNFVGGSPDRLIHLESTIPSAGRVIISNIDITNSFTNFSTIWVDENATEKLSVLGFIKNATVTRYYLGQLGTYINADGYFPDGIKIGSAGIRIMTGTGSPSGSVTAPLGSLYIRTNPTTASQRLYINTDGGTTWFGFTALG